jgi:hypothetical protein
MSNPKSSLKLNCSSHLSLSKHHHSHGSSHQSPHHFPTMPNFHSSSNSSQYQNQPQQEAPRLIHNALSCNELFNNKYPNYHSLTSRLHFHLAASVEIDLSLFANSAHVDSAKFVVHWMNNKELNFNIASDQFFNEIVDKLREEQQDQERATSQAQTPTRQSDETETGLDTTMTERVCSSNKERQRAEQQMALLSQGMDHRLDKIIKDWYSSQDLLFCIHPLDGSLLIWLVDWLDEYLPGNYRQPVVSFHAKLPNAISVGDAMSLTSSVFLYSQQMQLFSQTTQAYIKDRAATKAHDDHSKTGACLSPQNQATDLTIVNPTVHMFSGIINMVSRHNNGSLNLWRLQFQEESAYQSLVNITHVSRTCGHRFIVSDISSHPVLPFLLSNSANRPPTSEATHLDSHGSNTRFDYIDHSDYADRTDLYAPSVVTTSLRHKGSHPDTEQQGQMQQHQQNNNYLKGIIIWGVNPVGPLNITGGVYELARIDSMAENAFENIAWFPCLLPSFTLGSSSSSPSTLFVSTDCHGITIYQAVFDGRTLLHDLKKKKTGSISSGGGVDTTSAHTGTNEKLRRLKHKYESTLSSASVLSSVTDIAYDNFNVISIQSTARPGCILELDRCVDSEANWTKADLFHVFQENLLFAAKDQRSKFFEGSTSNQQFFAETYYLVLLEKQQLQNSQTSELVHVWKISVSSSPLFQDSSSSDSVASSCVNDPPQASQKSRMCITSTRVCRQQLSLPAGVTVVSADPAAADLSSSAMFTLSQVPYLFSTACSDGKLILSKIQ